MLLRHWPVALAGSCLLLMGCNGPKSHATTALVSLSVGKPDLAWQIFYSGKYNRVLGTYDDGAGTWMVYIRYWGCPVTRRGALRVTVYEDAYKWNSIGQGHYVADTSKPAHLYSKPAVDYSPSDNVLYTWPAHRESAWEVHIDVPSPRGCQIWWYGAETN